MKVPITAVIDTSVLISAFMSPTGASFAILEQYLERGGFLWLMTQPLYDEYTDKLIDKFPEMKKRALKRGEKISLEDFDEVLAYITKTASWVQVDNVQAGITEDPDDDHIGTLAVELGVDYLVTLDGDFATMKKGRYTVKVIRPGEFLAILRVAT